MGGQTRYVTQREHDSSLTPIDELPHGGRIQVVGHGRWNALNDHMEMGGLDASQLSDALKILPTDNTHGAIKRVSLIV